MLNERKAQSVSYDTRAGSARVVVASGSGTGREGRGTALLDAKGQIVGVDVDEGSEPRVVVMLGAHEAVARTHATRVTVTRDAGGEVLSVVVHDLGR
jgi:hypothetical protein